MLTFARLEPENSIFEHLHDGPILDRRIPMVSRYQSGGIATIGPRRLSGSHQPSKNRQELATFHLTHPICIDHGTSSAAYPSQTKVPAGRRNVLYQTRLGTIVGYEPVSS